MVLCGAAADSPFAGEKHAQLNCRRSHGASLDRFREDGIVECRVRLCETWMDGGSAGHVIGRRESGGAAVVLRLFKRHHGCDGGSVGFREDGGEDGHLLGGDVPGLRGECGNHGGRGGRGGDVPDRGEALLDDHRYCRKQRSCRGGEWLLHSGFGRGGQDFPSRSVGFAGECRFGTTKVLPEGSRWLVHGTQTSSASSGSV